MEIDVKSNLFFRQLTTVHQFKTMNMRFLTRYY